MSEMNLRCELSGGPLPNPPPHAGEGARVASGWGRHLRLTPYASLLTLCALAFGASAQDGLRDPTQPTALNERARASTSSVVAGPRWRLQSTLIADDRRLAVINGKTLRVGDAVDRATLIEVRAEGVTLEYERVRMDILLLPASVRVKRAGGHQ